MSEPRGYWRESDGQRLTQSEALDIWAEHAYRILVRTAGSYHAVIEYGQLAEAVQTQSGVRTRAAMRNWIGAVLGRVLERAHAQNEPPLTALVVHAGDGMVGDGYEAVLTIAGESPVQDVMEREHHAAQARLDCYRHFGASLPPSGAVPALAPALAEKVARRRARDYVRPMRVCPNCFIGLPASGVCDHCGDR